MGIISFRRNFINFAMFFNFNLRMYKRFLLTLIAVSASTLALFAHSFTLVIDAGHGGHDAGAIGAISKEKDINLRTALAFGAYVERNCPDVKVIYTRSTDVFVTLNGRAEIANKAKADLFISIHTNSLPAGHTARGLETYTLGMHRASDNLDVAKRENSVILVEKDYKTKYEGFDPNSSESYIMFEFMQDHNMAKSVELAKLVQSNVCASANRPNKGVKQAGFLVLRETSMPSCLIELGFISTPDEEQLLNNAGFIDNMAKGIYNAFIAYKKKYDTNISVPYRKEVSNKIDIPTVVPPAVDIQEHDSSRVSHNSAATQTQVKKAAGNAQRTGGDTRTSGKTKETARTTEKSKGTEKSAAAKQTAKAAAGAPVFKIQICTADRVLSSSDSRLKGQNADYFKEGNMVKYTVGNSTDYNEIYRMRKTLVDKFPDSFIIAFKNGKKMDINEAIKEFKANRTKTASAGTASGKTAK